MRARTVIARIALALSLTAAFAPVASAQEAPAPSTTAAPASASPEAPVVAPQATPPVPAVSPAPAAPPPAPAAKIDLRQPESAPDCAPKDEASEGAGLFFIGIGFFDFAALNRRLRANGYESIDDGLTLIGGEGHAVLPSGFVVGARGGGILSSDGRGPNGYERSFGGGYGMLDLGLALVRTRPILVTLTSGLGGYGLSLGISERQSAPFDAVLQDPARSSSVSRGGLLVGLTLGVDGRVPIGPVERGRQGFFTLGARLGALYGPPLGGWGLDEGGDATSGPGRGLIGAYGALAVGFGGGAVDRW
jgi:hypothetical protein